MVSLPRKYAPSGMRHLAVLLALCGVLAASGISHAAQQDLAALRAALQSKQVVTRIEAVRGLQALGPAAEPAVPALALALKDDYWDVRKGAAAALAAIGPKAVPALNTALGDSHFWSRMYAAEAAGLMGSPARDAVPALVKTLQDRDADVRMWAAWALGSIGPDAQAAIPALTAGLQSDGSAAARYMAWALGKIGPAAAASVPVLIEAMDKGVDGDSIADALAGIGPVAVDGLIQALASPQTSKGQAFQIIATLGKMGPAAASAVPLLAKELENPRDQWFGASAAGALGAIGPKAQAAVPALVNGLQHSYADLRLNCAESLGKIGDAIAVPALTATAANDKDEQVRRAAAKALATLQAK